MTDAQKRYAEINEFMANNPGLSKTQVAQHFKCGRSTINRALEASGNTDNRISIEEDGDTLVAESISAEIRTLADLIKFAEIDEDVWEPHKPTANIWGDKYQIKAEFKRKVKKFEQEALESLLADIKKESPETNAPPIYLKEDIDDPHMLEIALYDIHFGKMAWAAETGTDYDLKIAEQVYMRAVADLVTKACPFGIDKILLPVGQDFFQINNQQQTTAAGTPQDTDGRLAKIFEVGCRAVKWAIDYCADIAPVEVLWVPGNHSPETSYFLCKYLEAWYHGNETVDIDCSPKTRKYRLYGTSLVGFAHGNELRKQDLPLIMAGEVPQLWAKSKHREIHVGHLHKKKESRYMAGDTFNPVIVRIIPSLCGTDAWHYKNGYVKDDKTRAAEAYLWSKKNGYTGHFSTNVEEK